MPITVSSLALVSANQTDPNETANGFSQLFSNGRHLGSAEGRFVTFWSTASDLVGSDANNEFDVFVRDLQTGTTTLVSAAAGGGSGNGMSADPSISSSGRYVVFDSQSTDLTATTDTNGAVSDIYLRDLQTGTTTLVSLGTSGQANADSYLPSISDDGRYVAFETTATNLVAGITDGLGHVYVRDIVSGTTALISQNSGGDAGDAASSYSSIAADGRYVVFVTEATNLGGTDNNSGTGAYDVYVRDLVAGTTTLVSESTGGGSGDGISDLPSISANGRYVAFYSEATDLVAGDTNGAADIFVRDLVANTTTLVSTGAGGASNGGSSDPIISADGRFVTFSSEADNLVSGDTNGVADVFVRDLVTGTTARITLPAGTEFNQISGTPSFAGGNVAFYTAATNHGFSNSNGSLDIIMATLVDSTSETLTGGAGVNSLRGSLGGDDITAGAGADIVTGNGGNDTMHATVGDLVAGDVMNGGSGTDTLSLTIGTGQTADLTGVTLQSIEVTQLIVSNDWTIDFALLDTLFDKGVATVDFNRAGFEYDAVRNVSGNTVVTLHDQTPSARDYATRVDTYTEAGVRLATVVDYDDGSHAALTYVGGVRSHNVLTDNPTVPGANYFSTVITDYDLAGILTGRVTNYDNGNVLTQVYQASGARTDTTQDNAGVHNFSTSTTSFDALGRQTAATVTYDNGNTATFEYTTGLPSRTVVTDTNNDDPYITQETLFNGSGQVSQINIDWDNGWYHETSYASGSGVLRKAVLTDVGAPDSYTTVTTNYSAAGVLTDRVTLYDNANILTQIYGSDGSRTDSIQDIGNVTNFVTSSTSYDAAGRAISGTTLYDNGNTGTFEYTAAGTPLRTTMTDTNNDDSYASIETAFAAGGGIELVRNTWDNGTTWVSGGAGNSGNNTLAGGTTNDIITGYAGADAMTGGGGRDTFWYRSAADAGDTITDFITAAGIDEDKLDLRAMYGEFTNTSGPRSVAQAVSTGHLTFTQDGADTRVYVDTSGGADNNVLLATLLGTTSTDVLADTLL